jgi:hypothetical protein
VLVWSNSSQLFSNVAALKRPLDNPGLENNL